MSGTKVSKGANGPLGAIIYSSALRIARHCAGTSQGTQHLSFVLPITHEYAGILQDSAKWFWQSR